MQGFYTPYGTFVVATTPYGQALGLQVQQPRPSQEYFGQSNAVWTNLGNGQRMAQTANGRTFIQDQFGRTVSVPISKPRCIGTKVQCFGSHWRIAEKYLVKFYSDGTSKKKKLLATVRKETTVKRHGASQVFTIWDWTDGTQTTKKLK